MLLLYSRKGWRGESLANLANRLRFTKLKPSKVVATINNPLADLSIHQTFFCQTLEKSKFAKHSPRQTFPLYGIILTGGFHLPGIDWSESLVKHNSSYKAIHEHSLDILHNHGLQQLVTFPTRQVNTLDLVATNKPSTIINIQSSAGVSDHDMVLFEVRSQVKMIEQPSRTIYMYDRANWDALREELHVALTTDHVDTLEGTDVEQLRMV